MAPYRRLPLRRFALSALSPSPTGDPQLHLQRISASSFRNLEPFSLELGPGFNLFWGENAQGKTNLLEAVYYLLTLRALRPVKPRQLISWSSREAEVGGRVRTRSGQRDFSVIVSGRRRKLLVNGATPLEMEDYFGEARAIAFTPEDLQLVRGAPDLRRRFMDRAIFNSNVVYLSEAREYQRCLRHRNALLKRGEADEGLLDAWTVQLAELGARMIRRRGKLLQRLAPVVCEAFSSIFPKGPNIDVLYSSRTIRRLKQRERTEANGDDFQPDEQELAHCLLEQFAEKRSTELDRGASLCGPHLDDLEFKLEGRSFKNVASQGQTRAFALALKMAEIRLVSQDTGEIPIFLLDDVAGELDSRHAGFFFEFLESTGGQALLTATEPSLVKLGQATGLPEFQVQDGRIISTEDTE